MSGLPFSTSSLMSLSHNEGLWFISFSLCSFHQLPAKCSNLGRDVSLYQVVSLLFNKLSSHVDNITCEIPSPALFPGEGKGVFIEKAALEQCREFLSSLVLPLGLPQTEWADLEAVGWSFGCSPQLAADWAHPLHTLITAECSCFKTGTCRY